MRHVATIAALTLRLAWRSGVLWAMVGLTGGTAVFIFFASTGDGILVNELQLRIQYSYALSYALLTLLIIAAACFGVRSQLRGRQLHLLTSRPLRRSHLWLGQWLGWLLVAAAGELALLVCIAGSAWGYARGYDLPAIAAAQAFFARARRQVLPEQEPIATVVRRRLDAMIAAGNLTPAEIDDELWNAQLETARRAEQRVTHSEQKVWHFDLHGCPQNVEALELRYRFCSAAGQDPIRGRWSVSAPGEPGGFSADFQVLPFAYGVLRVPITAVPPSGRFELRLDSQYDGELVVNRGTGLRLYCAATPLVGNVLRALAFQLVHLAIAVAVGLTVGVAFTAWVAAFLAMVLYLLAVSSRFFTGVLEALGTGYEITTLNRVAQAVIGAGLWLSKGLEPPPIIGAVGGGIAIPAAELSISWLPGALVYGIAAGAFGALLLTRKELDKIIT